MKFTIAFLLVICSTVFAESPFDLHGGISQNGQGIQLTPNLSGAQIGREDEIQGKCETKTADLIPVVIPCRNIELILMRGESKEIARGNIDPAGRFQFDNLPYGSYSLIVKMPKGVQTRLDGLKPGFSYTISSADTTPGR